MSTYKEQDIENLLAHLREGIASDSVLALADDIRVDCEGAGDGESVWMHPVLPGARYGKDDKVIYDPFDTLPGRSLKSSGGLPMVEFYLHRGDDRPDATRNVKDMEPAPYLIGRYYMKTLLADHLDRGILLQDMPRLALSADTVADVQDALAKAVRAYAAACDFEIDGADADIARCLAQGGGRAAGAKVSAVYVPVGDLPRETTVFPDIARAAASIGLEDPETETLAEYGGVTVSLVRAADAEGSELKPNRAWARGGATEIVRGGFLVIATDGDGEVVDLPKWAIESAKTRFADPSTGPFQASAEFMREVRRGLGEQIEQAGRTPSEFRPPRHRIRQKGRPMPAYAGAGAASGENRTSQGGPYAARLRQRTARQDRDAATARPRLRQGAVRVAPGVHAVEDRHLERGLLPRRRHIELDALAHPQQADAHVHLHPDRDRQIFRGHERVLVFGTVGGQLNPIDMIKRSDFEPFELRRIAFAAILTALPPAIFQLQRAASVVLSCPTGYYSPASAAWFLTRGCLGAVWVPIALLVAATIACKAQRRLLDLGIAAVLLALSVRSAILLDAYSIGYLAIAFACFALAGLKEE